MPIDRAHHVESAITPPPRRFDASVIARFRGGDREAFLTVYAGCAPQLRAVVGRFFSRPFEREEALQEVWLLAHRMAAAYDPDRGELVPWLRAIAANRCKELLRARGRRPDIDTNGDGDDDALPAVSNPEASARDERVRTAVARFEGALEPELARVFRLSLVEERGHEEVARALGISARRCKYLRMKLLAQAGADTELRRALGEVTEP